MSDAEPLDLPRLGGLTSAEASDRLAREGANEIASARRGGLLRVAGEVLREPMILLLVSCAAVYLVVGDLREAVVLLVSVLVVVGITIFQGRKTERALEALRDLSSPRALVVRDGEARRIAGREVVRGDLILVSEGDRVPADGELSWASNLSVDESLLTGESVPVLKGAAGEAGSGLPKQEGRIFSGTLVVAGQGLARVVATGSSTEMGRIGRSLGAIEMEKTPLQRQMGRIVARLAAIGAGLCLLVALLYGLSRGSVFDGLLAGLALAMSILPEELPVVLTIFLALGAWRISRKQVLTRRVAAIEALGAATVLCVDKTGTLTVNRMSVARLAAAGGILDVAGARTLPEDFHELVEYAVLASRRAPFDPMEQAIRELGLRTLARTEHLHEDWELLREYPLSARRLAVSHAWKAHAREESVIAAKGAPEAIADLCHLGPREAERLFATVEELAGAGLRVLAVARARFRGATLPEDVHDYPFELLGLVGLEDPLRASVPAAIRDCKTAGIRVVMITGDYPVTASKIAREIGLESGAMMTGAELDAQDDAALERRIEAVSVFARVVPEQKLRIVRALQANGEVVAMTGDGVNDAPALKAAHIGIAMGGRGTDVAREAAALVLLDDDFSSIVAAVRLGRRIFDNLKKVIAYLLAIHVAIAGMALFPVLAGWPLLLLPVQIVFLELIIDPASSIAFEAEPAEEGIMRRPPRSPTEPLLSRRVLVLSALQGAGVLAAALAVLVAMPGHGDPEGPGRAAAFAALIIGNLGLILT
ncbi:MAG TPA: HAD-IC family P-type ATPase, partial [Thermoanaerobaculia bacterium]|nr:HAD-IC family P-type ATPase [Thermoanaerobaculia bacterium]